VQLGQEGEVIKNVMPVFEGFDVVTLNAMLFTASIPGGRGVMGTIPVTTRG
jgi:hypothetical protein